MTPFQKSFISDCLDNIVRILSNDSELNNACHHFAQGDSDNTRYQSSNITDASNWTPEDRNKLTSAVFEAIVQTTKKTCTDETLIIQINDANALFLTTIVPKLTANTESNNRLNSVQANSARIKSEINDDSTLLNPYAFFSVAGVMAFAAAAATFVLQKK